MKKVLTYVLSIVTVVALTIVGTLAYLTDRDSKTNIFTVGDVSIELNEVFEQGAQLIPGKYIEKVPTITNTGKNDAWVWMTFAIPSALDNWNPAGQEGSDKNVIHWNPLGATTEGYVTDARVENAIANGYLPAGTTAQNIIENKQTWKVFNEYTYQGEINGVKYNIYVLPYNSTLEPGETTLPSVYNVYMDPHVDIEPNGDWYHVEEGKVTKLNWNSNTDGNPLIYVSAYAIQDEGFETVDKAYAAYNSQWGDLGIEYAGGSKVYSANTQDALKESVNNENAIIVLEKGNYAIPSNFAKDVTLVCEPGTVFEGTSSLNVNGATIVGAKFDGENENAATGTINGTFKDCTFEGQAGLRWAYAGENVVFENCVFNPTTGSRGIHFDGGTNEVIFKNCTISGFNAVGEEIEKLTFEGCTFTSGNTNYNGLNLYCDTELIDCTFKFEGGSITEFIDYEASGKTLTITNSIATMNGNAMNIKDKIGGSCIGGTTIIIDGVTQ